jgi:hypothetical protein
MRKGSLGNLAREFGVISRAACDPSAPARCEIEALAPSVPNVHQVVDEIELGRTARWRSYGAEGFDG